MKSCAFTGHRNLEKHITKESLQKEIEKLVKEGIDTFYCGLALGFDMLCAEATVALKESYPYIRLIGCVPCEGQEKYFTKADKERYTFLRSSCDEVVVLFERYNPWCFHKRNDYMCERADMALAYLKTDKGGTAYTVRAFERAGKKIVFFYG